MLSVVTPTNDTKYLREAYDSLLSQTCGDWEWILLANGDLDMRRLFEVGVLTDERVRCFTADSTSQFVGDLKNQACSRAKGEIIVELDHDDILLPTALEKIKQAFRDNADAVFCYSNSAHFNDDETRSPYLFNPAHGWQYRDSVIGGYTYKEALQPEAIPPNLSYIWYAPDHFRAWRKDAYDRAGCHDKEMRVLDDQDLMCRLYQQGRFVHINELLYLYRVHGENSWLKYNGEIQGNTLRLHDVYLEAMMKTWCEREGLRVIDLCSGDACPDGYEAFDIQTGTDLNEPWNFAEDNSVGLIRAVDAIEHLHDPMHVMREAYRVLRHGGMFLIEVPSTDGRGAYQDPTHVSFFNENSFWYYTNREFNKYLGGRCPVRFQYHRGMTYFPNEFCKQHNIAYVRAHLAAIKEDSPRVFGLMNI